MTPTTEKPIKLPVPESVGLRDGKVVTIRPIRSDDAPRLQAFHARLSPETIYYRFMGAHPVLFSHEAEHFAHVNYQTRMAFVATLEQGDQEIIVGVARYETLASQGPSEAEAALVIEDAYQHQGLGAILAGRLAAYGRNHGLKVFVAEINAENDLILHFIRRSGLSAEKKMDGNTYSVRIKLV